MTAFAEAVRALLTKDLRCPKCGEENRPNVKPLIELDTTGTRARCDVCSTERPLIDFQPKENR